MVDSQVCQLVVTDRHDKVVVLTTSIVSRISIEQCQGRYHEQMGMSETQRILSMCTLVDND